MDCVDANVPGEAQPKPFDTGPASMAGEGESYHPPFNQVKSSLFANVLYDPRSYGYNDYHELDNFPDLSLLPSYLLEQAAENYPTFDDLDDPEELAGYVDLLHSLYMIDLQMSYETIWPETEVFIKTHGIHNLLPFHILAELTGENEDCLYEHMQTIQSILITILKRKFCRV